jgi:hypothetical protein
MRDDKDLEFGARHPTDLRDRFRIRYPDKYAKAGYKLKVKERERTFSKQAQAQEQEGHDDTSHLDQLLAPNLSQQAKTSYPHNDNTASSKDAYPSNYGSNTNMTSYLLTTNYNPNSTLKSFNPSSYLSDPLPTLPFEDADADLTQDMRNVGDESPITLSRNILRWADANPSSLYAFTPTTASSSTPTSTGNTHGAGHCNKVMGERGAGGGAFGGGEGGNSGGLNGFAGGSGGGQQQLTDGARATVLPEADSWLLGGEKVQAFGTYRYRS